MDQQIRHLQEASASAPGPAATTELYALRKQRNSLLPISSLPAEIFVEILHDVIEGLPSPSLELMQLQTISSFWWNVTNGSSSLWRVIIFDCPSAYIALRRSGIALLDIKILSCYAKKQPQVQNFAEAVGPHSSRWRSLKFDGLRAYFKFLLPFIRSPLPHLKDLTLHVQPESILPSFPKSTALRHLNLRFCSPPKNVEISGLTTLSLQTLVDADAPKVSHILKILERCPDLVELKLDEVRPPGTVEIEGRQSKHPIILSKLRFLALKNLYEPTSENILRHVRADNLELADLDIQASPGSMLLATLFREGPTPSSPLRILRQGDHPVLNIDIWPFRVSATYSNSQQDLRIVLRSQRQGKSITAGLALLYPSFPLASEVHLKLHGELGEYSPGLDLIPNLTHLAIADATTAKPIVDYLLSAEEGGARELPCPRLESLSLEAWSDEEVVRRLMKVRQPRLKVSWGLGAPAPKPYVVRTY